MSDVYQEGYDALGKGLTLDDNPYVGQPENEQRWNEGWEDAKIDRDLNTRSICKEEP